MTQIIRTCPSPRPLYLYWKAVNYAPAPSWDADEEPSSKYEEFIEWCYENGHEDIEDIENRASDRKLSEEERHEAMSELDSLADDFLNGDFCPPDDEPSGTWDWSPVGW